MNAKQSQQRFWPCQENRPIKTIDEAILMVWPKIGDIILATYGQIWNWRVGLWPAWKSWCTWVAIESYWCWLQVSFLSRLKFSISFRSFPKLLQGVSVAGTISASVFLFQYFWDPTHATNKLVMWGKTLNVLKAGTDCTFVRTFDCNYFHPSLT